MAQAAIDRLDELDGDSDFETGTDLEDDFMISRRALVDFDQGPGCPISDVDCCIASDDDAGRAVADDYHGTPEDAEAETDRGAEDYGEEDKPEPELDCVEINPGKLVIRIHSPVPARRRTGRLSLNYGSGTVA